MISHHHSANSWKLTTMPSSQSLTSLVPAIVLPICSIFSSPSQSISLRLILRCTKSMMRSMSLLNLFCSFWWWLRHWSGVLLCNSLERRLKTTDLRRASSELKSRRYLERKSRQMRFSYSDQLPCCTLRPSIGSASFLYSLRSGQQSSRYVEELSLLTIFRRARLIFPFPHSLMRYFGPSPSPDSQCIQYNTNKMVQHTQAPTCLRGP